MAGRIPREFIDDLLARTDIVELVDTRVRLKKAGRNYQACCPFHSEKSPSFTVSQEKQFYHCFGCGAHGNAISFLMEFDRLEFPEAIEDLARYHSVDVPREKNSGPVSTPQQKQQREDDYQLMEKISRYFEHQLKHHEQGNNAIEYLKSRGLSGEVVKQFAIGYAAPEWDGALKAFARDPQSRQQLLDLKLITENDQKRQFDFFRDRIMFPIRDRRGRVIGFGGRVMGDGGPKYLNSPETRIFHKGHELYGFYQAKQANRSLQKLLIVEGYMDVVALAQYGINYAVASLGTSTTSEHVQLLFRNAAQIICCYDGDRAGRDAAWRTLENALPHLKDGVELKFLFLPDGEDPDTMVRKTGKDAFETELDKAKPLSEFLFENLLQKHHVGSDEGKAALKAEATELIQRVSGEYQTDLLKETLENKLGTRPYKLDLARDIQEEHQRGQPKKSDYSTPSEINLTPVRKMIRLLLMNPELASANPQVNISALDLDSMKGLIFLNEVYQLCLSGGQSTASILEHFRGDPRGVHLSKLLSVDHNADETNPNKLYEDGFKHLTNTQLDSRYQQLRAKEKMTREEKQEFMLLTQAKSTYSVE